jgi:histidine triad (HIT) family protein
VNCEVDTTVDDCIFCKIVRGEIPSARVAENERAIAFDDISPKAPVHVLVIPKTHIPALHEAAADNRDDLADCLLLCNDVARAKGVVDRGFQVRTHDGADGGQEVMHLHFHVLGGRKIAFGV